MKTIINLVDRRYGNLATTTTSTDPIKLVEYYLEVLDPTKQSVVIRVEGVASMTTKWEITDGYGWDDKDRLWSVTMDDEWVYEPRNRRDLVDLIKKEMNEVVQIAEEWKPWL